jgi:hypothetical protein
MRSYFILAVGLGVILMAGLLSAATGAETPNPATQEVTGTIKDALGRPIPAAAVTLQDGRGKNVAKATSYSVGHSLSRASQPESTQCWATKRGSSPRPRSLR